MIGPSPKQTAYELPGWVLGIDIGKVAKSRARTVQGRIILSGVRDGSWMGNKVEPGHSEERFRRYQRVPYGVYA